MRNRTNRRGAALILAIIAFIILAGIGAAFFSFALARGQVTSKASSSDSALHIAEAGIDDMINRMSAWGMGYSGTASVYTVIKTDVGGGKGQITGTVNGGTYTVEIYPAYTAKGTYRLVSTATKGTEKRGIETWVSPTDTDPFPDFGLFGDVSVDAGGTMTSDSYKSTLGYNPTAHTHGGVSYTYDRPNGSIGSNGVVTGNGNSKVFGNATPGPGNPPASGFGFLLGSPSAATSTVQLQAVTYPTTFPAGSATSLPNAATITGYNNKVITLDGTTANYHLSSLSFGQPRTVRVTGKVTLYVDGAISLNSQDEFLLEGDNASVEIIHGTGDLHVNGQSLTGMSSNLKKTADKFKITSASTGDIQFNGSATIYAMVYAPKASFTQNGTSDFYGALVSSTVKVTGTGNFHYDEDLNMNLNSNFEYKIKAWKEFTP
jgi:hypothetical protein